MQASNSFALLPPVAVAFYKGRNTNIASSEAHHKDRPPEAPQALCGRMLTPSGR
jgi:hypothetical protein